MVSGSHTSRRRVECFIARPASIIRDLVDEIGAGQDARNLVHSGRCDRVEVGDERAATGTVDGFGLAKWLTEHRPELHVLLAGTVPRAVENAKQLCDEGSMRMPYDPRFVHDHIRRLLAARQAASRPR